MQTEKTLMNNAWMVCGIAAVLFPESRPRLLLLQVLSVGSGGRCMRVTLGF